MPTIFDLYCLVASINQSHCLVRTFWMRKTDLLIIRDSSDHITWEASYGIMFDWLPYWGSRSLSDMLLHCHAENLPGLISEAYFRESVCWYQKSVLYNAMPCCCLVDARLLHSFLSPSSQSTGILFWNIASEGFQGKPEVTRVFS